jgi:hypothetical protein
MVELIFFCDPVALCRPSSGKIMARPLLERIRRASDPSVLVEYFAPAARIRNGRLWRFGSP